MSGARRTEALSLAALLAAALLATAGAGAATEVRPEVARPRVVLAIAAGCAEPFERLLCSGFTKALRVTGVAGRIVSPTGREDLVDTLVLLGTQHYDLVMVTGYQYYEPLGEAARRRPRARYAIMDSPRANVAGRPPNVHGVVFRTSEAAYLAGWLAGSLEARRAGRATVGVVGGLRIPSVEDFVIGFRAGARRAAPRIRVLVGYSDDFVDPAKCEAIARNQIAKGAGIVFNVAGACGLGTIEAARRAGAWAIGVDTDQSFLGPHVLTSVLKHYDMGFVTVLRRVKAGRLVLARDTVLTLREDAVGLGRISPSVPSSVRAGLERLRGDIAAGRVRVPGAFPDPR